MPEQNKNSREPQIGGATFATTHWSAVLSAGGSPSASSAQALERLCRDYWFPLYAFIRREGHGPIEAQDLTQEFFARLLQGNYLASVGPEKGRFRSFLLASLKHFLANEWDRQHRQKRGGDALILSLDDDSAETRYLAEATQDTTAEKIYARRWAQTVVERFWNNCAPRPVARSNSGASTLSKIAWWTIPKRLPTRTWPAISG